MTITEARDLQKQLQRKIAEAIGQFEHTTDLRVTAIDVDAIDATTLFSESKFFIPSVKVRVELP